MEKLPMCRICLSEDVRMYVVVNKNLHELYEKLTDVPFVTKDSRPMLACFFCCTKLKQCCRFLNKCLEAEKLFAQMMDGDYEPNLLINQDREYFNGFIKTPVENISIVDVGQIERKSFVKEEFVRAVSEKQMCNIQPKEGYIINIEPKVEHLSDEPEPNNVDYSYPEVADITENHLDSDLGYVPLIRIKTEVGEVSRKEHRATDSEQAAVAKKPKLNTLRLKLEDVIIEEQKKNEQSDINVFQTTRNRTCKRVTNSGVVRCNNNNIANKRERHTRFHIGDKPYKCDMCQSSFKKMAHLTRHILRHTGEKPHKCNLCQRSFSQLCNLKRHIRTHNGEKPYKCDLCQCSFNDKRDLSKHIWDHTGEKPFKCEICLERFNDKRVLTKHMRKHTGKKPLRCEICERNFCYTSDLEKHIRIHTGEKPYKCEICQRGFNVKGNLKKHFVTHTGEKQL